MSEIPLSQISGENVLRSSHRFSLSSWIQAKEKKKKMHLLQGNIELSSTSKILSDLMEYIGFLGGSVVNNLPANVGDLGSIPWS